MTQLPKVKTRKSKRLGRGYGSGKGGHTSSRGTKGQRSRSKVHVLFEGTKMRKTFIKRLPLKRGKDKFKAKVKPLVVNLSYLETLPSGAKVDVDLLVKEGIVKESDAKAYGVKILGNGDIKKKLTIALPISQSAAKKVEKAGGTVA